MAARAPKELLTQFDELLKSQLDSGDDFFNTLDTNQSGALDASQLKEGLRAHGLVLNDAEVGYLMGVLDTGGEGFITPDKFRFVDPRVGLKISRAEASRRQATSQPGMGASVLISAAASIISVNFIHPVELVKTRIQVTGLPLTSTIGSLVRTEGYRALYKGIQPAWMREGSYTALKMGMYVPVRDYIADSPNATPMEMFFAGCLTGAIGSATSNPCDVLKTIQMADDKGSTSLTALVRRLYSEEGIGGFYRGLSANVTRATVNNGVKFAAYDISKQAVLDITGWDRKDSRNFVLSSVISSFVMAVAIAPLDMMRTKLMNQPVDGHAVKNQQVYKGFADCGTRIMRKHGPLAFYRGFVPLYSRMLPATVLQLGIFEKLLQFAGYDNI